MDDEQCGRIRIQSDSLSLLRRIVETSYKLDSELLVLLGKIEVDGEPVKSDSR